jgi:hypothetical protein
MLWHRSIDLVHHDDVGRAEDGLPGRIAGGIVRPERIHHDEMKRGAEEGKVGLCRGASHDVLVVDPGE